MTRNRSSDGGYLVGHARPPDEPRVVARSPMAVVWALCGGNRV